MPASRCPKHTSRENCKGSCKWVDDACVASDRTPRYTVKRVNPWLVHVASVREANPGLSYKDVLKMASENYTKIDKPVKSSKRSMAVAVAAVPQLSERQSRPY